MKLSLHLRNLFLLNLALLGIIAGCSSSISLSPAPVQTPTFTPLFTSTPGSPTNSPTNSPSNTPTKATPIPDPGTATSMPTNSPTSSPTNSPSITPSTATTPNTWTYTPSPAAPTPTLTNSPSSTPSNTPTNTPSATPTPSGTWYTPTQVNTVTATATGCGKTGNSIYPFPTTQPNPVSGGTTAVGLAFQIGLCCTSSCNGTQSPVFTSFTLATTLIGSAVPNNLSTQILQVLLWDGTNILATSAYSGGPITFSGFSSSHGFYYVEYVLAPGASGEISTTLPAFGSFGGYLQTASTPGGLWPEPGSFNALTGYLSVTSPSPAITSTPTQTFTPTATITVSACANSGVFGDSAAGTGPVTYMATTLVQEYYLGQSSSVTQLSVNLASPMVGSLGIYTNNYSTGGSYAMYLIYASASQPLSAGVNSVVVSPPVNLPTGNYWLACASTTAPIVLNAASGSYSYVSWEGQGAFMPNPYISPTGMPPIPTPPPTSTSNQGMIYAGYCY